MKTTIRLLALAALVLASGSCNHRESPFRPLTPTSSLAPQGVYSIGLQPLATYGPATVQGTILLAAAAPDGGLQVSLSSSAPTLLSLPRTVTVPAGKDTVGFQGTVRQVLADQDVTLTAAAATGRAATTTLSLWAILPTFFSFTSDPGDSVGDGGVGRFTPPSTSFSAWCSSNGVGIRFSDQAFRWWSLSFRAPSGHPLVVGTYEGAKGWSYDSTAPGLDVSVSYRSCSRSTGRFTIREADFSPSGQVRHFWATFEQHCGNGTPALRGDVRITNGPTVTGNSCLR
jgi:hypothetical protein